MGGSGGDSFFYGEKDIKSIWEKIKESEELEKKQQYNQTVNDFLISRLGNLNSRDNEAISDSIDLVKDLMKDEIDGTVDLRFGGSVSKHTYVDGLSDVDTLMLIDKTELSNCTPNQIKEYLNNILSSKLGEDNVKEGNLALTLFVNSVELQILPALRSGLHYKISDESGNNWLLIKPKAFAEHLTKANETLSFKLIPTIKIAKAIMSQLPDKKRLEGYHTESISIEVFKNYTGNTNYKDLVMHFFKEAAIRVLKPIKDKSGQSIHVDSYLGKENSNSRKLIKNTLENIYKKMLQAEDARLMNYWYDIL